MSTVTLVPDVIEMMAKSPFEERIKCPICEGAKDPRDWICHECFEKHGDCVVQDVQRAVNRVINRVAPEVWRDILEAVRKLLSASDIPKGMEDKHLVAAIKLKPIFADVPDGTMFAALVIVRKEMAARARAIAQREERVARAKARAIAQREERAARWQIALTAVRSKYLNGKKINFSFFLDHPVSFDGSGGRISDSMMQAACLEVRNEKRLAEKSQIAAAFVNSHLL